MVLNVGMGVRPQAQGLARIAGALIVELNISWEIESFIKCVLKSQLNKAESYALCYLLKFPGLVILQISVF